MSKELENTENKENTNENLDVKDNIVDNNENNVDNNDIDLEKIKNIMNQENNEEENKDVEEYQLPDYLLNEDENLNEIRELYKNKKYKSDLDAIKDLLEENKKNSIVDLKDDYNEEDFINYTKKIGSAEKIEDLDKFLKKEELKLSDDQYEFTKNLIYNAKIPAKLANHVVKIYTEEQEKIYNKFYNDDKKEFENFVGNLKKNNIDFEKDVAPKIAKIQKRIGLSENDFDNLFSALGTTKAYKFLISLSSGLNTEKSKTDSIVNAGSANKNVNNSDIDSEINTLTEKYKNANNIERNEILQKIFKLKNIKNKS